MKTLKYKTQIEGIGLMTAIPVELEILPSSKKGIRFCIGEDTIEAKLQNVVSTEHCVVVGDIQKLSMGQNSPKVALIEHFMATCAILEIEALDVYFKNPNFEVAQKIGNVFEMPILDGSADVWVKKFKEVGFTGEAEPTKPLAEDVILQKGKSHVLLLQSNESTKITYSVNYNHPDLINRFVTLDEDNLQEIIEARTFGYLKDLDKLQAMGYSKGVSLENTLGLTDDSYTAPLRSGFEPAKHKILDIIGDLYLTGINPLKMKANIIVKEAGHSLHVECAKELMRRL